MAILTGERVEETAVRRFTFGPVFEMLKPLSASSMRISVSTTSRTFRLALLMLILSADRGSDRTHR
jgi:hypothetical protein